VVGAVAPVNDTLCYYMRDEWSDTLGFVMFHPQNAQDARPHYRFGGYYDYGLALAFFDGQRGTLAVEARTDTAEIWTTADSGYTWQLQWSSVAPLFRDAHYLDELTIWVVGDDSLALRSEDGGETWQAIDLPTDEDLFAVDGYDAEHLWISGSNGLVLYTDDGGLSWQDRSIDNVSDVWHLQAVRWAVYAEAQSLTFGTRLYRYSGIGAGVEQQRIAAPTWWTLQPDGFQLHLPQDEHVVSATVRDALGRVVRVGANTRTLIMSGQAPGAYLLHVRTASGDRSAKVVWPGEQ
jgi:hypothetical protein